MYENENVNNNGNSNEGNSSSAGSGPSAYFDYTKYPAGGGCGTPAAEPVKPVKKKKGGFRKVLASAGLGLMFGLFAGAGFYGVKLGTAALTENTLKVEQSSTAAPTIQNTVTPDTSLTQATQAPQVTNVAYDASDVVDAVMPAMVSIVNNYTQTVTNLWGQSYQQQGKSSGSGIIVAENASELLIVSNNHVVEGANDLEVTFIDGTTASANIKGLDSDMDLAVIAVSLDSLSAETKANIAVATLGDSTELRLGQSVIAIGNALGYGQSVTTGVISALDRELTMDDGSTGTFIQTDAAINPGNSGGALLNINGEVIGINSSKIGGTTVEGMGYAIPISSASPIIAELMEYQTKNKVSESNAGYMGITMQEIPDQMVSMYNMPQGVFVYSVEENSPAQQAGIVKGDIIVKLDGFKITSISDIKNAMQYCAAGNTATVTVKRAVNGEYESYDLEITFGQKPADK